MSPANHRHERVGEEIAHEINAMLAGELKDPRLEVSVVASEVRVQPDMKHARVFISVKERTRSRPTRSKRSNTLPGTSGGNWSNGCNSAACRSCTSFWIFRKNTWSALSAFEGNEEGQSARGAIVLSSWCLVAGRNS